MCYVLTMVVCLLGSGQYVVCVDNGCMSAVIRAVCCMC